MTVSNTVLLFSNSSKMADGKMLSLIQEFHITVKAKLLYMDTAMTLQNSGFHLWKKHMLNFMENMKCLMAAK